MIIRRSLAVALAAGFSLSAASAQPAGTLEGIALAQCQQVRSQVGLIVRARPGSKGKKLGSVPKGEQVQLAGRQIPGSNAVLAVFETEELEDSPNIAYWVKIKRPMAGYVLYSADEDPQNNYIGPCE